MNVHRISALLSATFASALLLGAPAAFASGSSGGGGSTTTTTSTPLVAGPCAQVLGESGSVVRYGGIDYLRFYATVRSCSLNTQYVYLRMTDVGTGVFDTSFAVNGSSTLLSGATLQGQTDGGMFGPTTPTSWTIRTEVHDLQSGALLATYTSTVAVQGTNRVGAT